MEEEGTRSSMGKRGQVAAPFLHGMNKNKPVAFSVAVLLSVTPWRKFNAARDSARPSRVLEKCPASADSVASGDRTPPAGLDA